MGATGLQGSAERRSRLIQDSMKINSQTPKAEFDVRRITIAFVRTLTSLIVYAYRLKPALKQGGSRSLRKGGAVSHVPYSPFSRLFPFLVPFPSSLLFLSSPLSLPLRSRSIKPARGLGSAVSSPSRVRGGTPLKKECTIMLSESHWWQSF